MAFSNHMAIALYESLCDEDRAEIDRLIEGLHDGEDDTEVFHALIQWLSPEWQELDADAGFGQAPYEQNNTWPHVREIRNEIADDYGTHLTDLNAGWNKISADYGEFLRRDRDEAFGSTPLEAYLMLIQEGYYPPPEILIAVADCFNAYFATNKKNDKKIELDLYFKNRKRGYGDFADQRRREHASREFSLMRQVNAFRNGKYRKSNKTDLAGEYLLSKSGAPRTRKASPTKEEVQVLLQAVKGRPKAEQEAWIKNLRLSYERKAAAWDNAFAEAEAGADALVQSYDELCRKEDKEK